MKVKRTERGWAGHFILSYRCLFTRNTLLEYKNVAIVVSTVGRLQKYGNRNFNNKDFETLGIDRYYETMVFHTDKNDKEFQDIDVSKQIYFDSDGAINIEYADNEANEMHETVVVEMIKKIKKGELNE